jgi:hypothetical protein
VLDWGTFHILLSLRISLTGALNFLVYSNIWIALAAVSLNLYFYEVTGVKADWRVCGFVFLATLFIYNFQRIAKLKTGAAFSGERLRWMHENYFASVTISILSLFASILIFFLLDVHTLYVLIPAGIISFFYVGRFLLRNVSGLRDVPFMKAYLVSFSWAGVTVLLPSLQAHFSSDYSLWIMLICIGTLVFSLAIIFDLRDERMDESSKRTVPQLIGKSGTIVLAVICLSFAMLFPLLLDLSKWMVSAVVIVCGTILIVQVSEKKSDFYYSFFLDGVLILPGFLTLFF